MKLIVKDLSTPNPQIISKPHFLSYHFLTDGSTVASSCVFGMLPVALMVQKYVGIS